MGTAVALAWRQQAHHSSQSLPSRFSKGRVRANQVADHLPRGNVEGALRWWSHRQRDRALRAETDSPRRRFLPGSYAHGLREHIDRNRFVSCLEFSITAKTVQVFQGSLPGGQLRPTTDTVSTPSRDASMQKDSRLRWSRLSKVTLDYWFLPPRDMS